MDDEPLPMPDHPDFVLVKKGETILLTVEERTVEAVAEIASQNGRSLMLTFEALLVGHLGMMPLLWSDEHGGFVAFYSGHTVKLAKKTTAN